MYLKTESFTFAGRGPGEKGNLHKICGSWGSSSTGEFHGFSSFGILCNTKTSQNGLSKYWDFFKVRPL